MHLTDRQLDRFFDLLDGLIVFTNERLRLVEGLSLPIVSEEAEMKAAYVCDHLWRHTEVIDEYVRLNPRNLRKADLDAVAAWRDAIFGKFTLVRFERGRAILMGQPGIFAVAGLDEDPQKRLTCCPDMVIASLLPFEGVIISDGLMFGDNIPFNDNELKLMNEALLQHEPEGIAWTAEEFQKRARKYHEQVREREFDELMSSLELEARQTRDGEKLPEGYHRGVLAGLSTEERKQKQKEYREAHAFGDSREVRDARERMLKAVAIKAEPTESLEECLAVGLRKYDLVELCKSLMVPRYGGKNKKGLAEALVGPLSRAFEPMQRDLKMCSPSAFALFERVVAAGGRVEDRVEDILLASYPVPMVPYIFQFHHEGKLVSVMPRELRAMAEKIDLEALSYERDRVQAAINCAEAMSEYYGLLTLREAHELYCNAVVDAYSLEDFIGILMREDSFDDMGFALQQWNGDSYLMHYTISDGHLHTLVASRYEEEINRIANGFAREGAGSSMAVNLYEKVLEEVEAERDELDKYRKHVLEVRARTPRRPLDAGAADGMAYDRLFELPAVVQLRDFYDAHVPDDQDDYTFADRAVEDLVLHAIDLGNVDLYLDAVEQSGWGNCAEDTGLLSRLVENAYGALPSWDFNGWSPQEIVENMAGRKVFYNARGELLHPALDDPCPCGSGKLFRDCHGA